jgi:hypothetical protein
MELLLNGNKLDVQLENEKNLHEILTFFEEECIKNNATIVQIALNDVVISASTLDTKFDTSISEIKKLEISTVCEDDIVSAMKNLSVQLTTICDGLEQIPVHLQTNKDSEAKSVITSFANAFDTLCHLISLTALFPNKFSEFKIEEMNINEYLKDFSPMLEEFEVALAEKDTVLIGDLAEYEIMPRLTKLIASIQKM